MSHGRWGGGDGESSGRVIFIRKYFLAPRLYYITNIAGLTMTQNAPFVEKLFSIF